MYGTVDGSEIPFTKGEMYIPGINLCNLFRISEASTVVLRDSIGFSSVSWNDLFRSSDFGMVSVQMKGTLL